MTETGNEAQKYGDRFGLILFFLVIVATAIVFLWTSTQNRKDAETPSTWIDDAGRLHVLGISLGETTLRDAEIRLKSKSDPALYIYPPTHPRAGLRLESYFPAIADHSRVILELEVDKTQLQGFQERSTLPHLYPNGIKRMNVAPADVPAMERLVVKRLTLVPSVPITPKMLKARFGGKFKSKVTDDGKKIFTFPGSGLVATISDNIATLVFSNPGDR